MKAALQGAGKTFEIKVYPGAPHGFHADYRAELPQGSRRGRMERDDRVVQEVQSTELNGARLTAERGAPAPRFCYGHACRAGSRPTAEVGR